MPRGEYLLEVRSEEIPARMLEPGVRELATRVFEELMARGIGPREVETGYTPRRLVLILSGLPEGEPDREEQVMGPPVRAPYTADGQPTPAPFTITSAEDYLTQLSSRHLEVRPSERKRKLHETMRDRAEALGGTLVDDPSLLEKLAAICEIPGVMEGSFGDAFLELPAEVLATSLRDHQSALTVAAPTPAGTHGKLLPYFLTVMDRP